jgi:type I restriction enzyme S subunit
MAWPKVYLRDVMRLDLDRVPIDRAETYDMVGVYSFARGLFRKEAVLGSNTSYKFFYRLKAEHVVMSQLFGWEGALALSADEFSGLYVSPQFPTFLCDPNRLDRQFLGWLIRRPSLWRDLGTRAKGMGDRRRTVSPDALLSSEIPLPPLAEQRRIVARIEELAALVEEARGLRVKAREEAEALLASASSQPFDTIAESNPSRPIGETFVFRNDLIRPTDGRSGKLRFIGLQHIESHTGKRIGEDHLLAEELEGRKFKFSPGEIVYGYLRPYLNKVWVADCEGVCSVDQYVIRPKPEIVDTGYLAHFMRSPIFLKQAIERTHNLLLPRLRIALLESISIPLLPIPEQRRIVAYLDGLQAQVDELTALQDAAQAELEALLPSVLDKAFRGEL